MNKSLENLCKNASKIGNVVHKGSGKFTEYFGVGEQTVTITVQKLTSVPYSKSFDCTCKHGSLFGKEHNIPCKHIFALIAWLIKKMSNKNEIRNALGGATNENK